MHANESERAGRSRAAWLAASLALHAALILLFVQTLGFPASGLDDQSQLAALAGQPLSRALSSVDHFGHYRPLKTLAFWVIAHDPARMAFVRALVLGLFLLSVAVVQRSAARLSGCSWVGLATAALWGLHPLTAAVVAWLSAANAVPCLLGVLGYLWAGEVQVGARGARWLRLSGLLSLGLAVASHELALVAPFVLLASRRLRGSPAAARSLYVGAGAIALSYLTVRLALGGSEPAYRFREVPRFQMMLSAARYFWENVWSLAFPFGRFGVLLGDSPEQHRVASVVSWVVLIMALWLARGLRRHTAPALGLVWVAAFLVPVSNFVPLGNTPVAAHYAYLPGVGLALAGAGGMALLVRRLGAARAALGRLVASLVLLFVAALACESQKVLAAHGSEEGLYALTRENHPDNVEARANLADVLVRAERYDEALQVLDEASALAPDDPMVLANRFELFARTGRPATALALLDAHPALLGEADHEIRRGELLLALGRHPQARAVLERAFAAIDPVAQPDARVRAGYQLVIALVQTGDEPRARALVARLLADHPGRRELLIAEELLREGADEQ